MGFSDKLKAAITCPNCGQKMKIHLKDLRPDRTVSCACGTPFTYRCDDSPRELLDEARKLERLLKKR